ncbi:hypothetical protein Tco_1425593 [Tanacetum coccineum]
MAEIGCNWARIGPSKSACLCAQLHTKWAVEIDLRAHWSSQVFIVIPIGLSGPSDGLRLHPICILQIPELLHQDLWDICRDNESLEARGVLDKINNHLKCFLLLWHCGFHSDISRANLNSLSEWTPFFITCNNLLCFLRIQDSA